jgi:hypothetical protein
MKKIFSIAGIVVVAALIGYGAYRSTTGPGNGESAAQPAPLTVEEQRQADLDKAAVSSQPQAERYKHPRLGFSFEKPTGYTVGSIKGDDGTETLVVQRSGGEIQTGFQIYISELTEPLEITPAVVKSELPGTSVSNAQKIVLDSIGKGMMFESNNESFGGKSFEIWFTGKGSIYQVTSYLTFTEQLKAIIGTWKF